MSGEFTGISRETSQAARLGSIIVGNVIVLDLTPPSAAIEVPPPVDDLIAGINLPENSSLEDMEPAVKRHWKRFERLEAVEMALGRRVDARSLVEDETLGAIVSIPNPSKAFAALLFCRAIEQQEQAAAQ